MRDLFIRIRHWQLFILLFLLPVAAFLVIFLNLDLKTILTEGRLTRLMIINLGLNLGATVLYWIWIWSVVITMKNRVPETIGNSYSRFKLFFLLQFLSIGLLLAGVYWLMQDFLVNPFRHMWVFPFFMLLGLVNLGIQGFFLYYASKILKTAELKREVKFTEHTNEFVLMWFYPIGVWIIQPLINKLSRES